MELLQLRYFCSAAETENFSDTAKQFYVPPSAVSQSIKRLEKELSVTLFSRQANRIRLNENGRIFYERVKSALRSLEDAQKQISDTGDRGRIKLSIYVNRRLVMQTVEKFRLQYPNVEIVTKYIVSPEQEDFDLVVTDEALGGEYTGQRLIREDIFLAMRRDHPLAHKETLTADDIRKEFFICTNQGSSLYRIAHTVCREMGFTPHIVIYSDDPYYIRKCVELGLGICLIPAISWKGQFSDQIVFKKMRTFPRTTYIYRNTGNYLPKCVDRFVDLLMAECSEESSSPES